MRIKFYTTTTEIQSSQIKELSVELYFLSTDEHFDRWTDLLEQANTLIPTLPQQLACALRAKAQQIQASITE